MFRARASVQTLALTLTLAWAAVQAGCGSDSNVETNGTFPEGEDASVNFGDASVADFTEAGGLSFSDAGKPVHTITIQPPNPTIDVTITNGVATLSPLSLKALGDNGQVVQAAWSFDRGELGTIGQTSGTFTPSGTSAGAGTVTARYAASQVTTTLTVRITSTQNGKPAGLDAGVGDSGSDGGNGAGGAGGVGGEGLGGPVDAPTQGLLLGNPTPPTKPATSAELSFLYPYDNTVWPRGVLAPLMQWQTSHASSAVYIHLKQKNFEFSGFYSGTALVHQPIDTSAWNQAVESNSGDPLHVEITVASGGVAYGPIAQNWVIAPGVLKGTVYYNSYNSRLAGAGNGAVLAIKPGAAAPNIAIPGSETQCHVCHEVSDDGSTLVMEDQSYSDGASYDLTKNGQTIASYAGVATDMTSNDRKFLWSAMYPDGSFAMSNSRHAREHSLLDSQLFRRSDGTAIPTTGWAPGVTSAVTPTFSKDGRHLAFNFWEGAGAGGVLNGAGHSLAMIDFSCNSADGGTDGGIGCGPTPYTFSNLRELYRDPARYPGWPAFVPDGTGLVFHNTLTVGACSPDCELTTWSGSRAELWWTNTQSTPQPKRMDALNGFGTGGVSYLPTNANHADDTGVNYEPTMNPIASGGYYWVVFTSRRMYGNIAAGDAYDNGDGTYPIPKKLWVAAIDINPTPGKDPSHPAFYLPGQELNAGNLRGFWVVDPCHTDGTTCETGDECCGGFCRSPEDGGALVCQEKPTQGCSQEFEKCTKTADCCDAPSGYECLNGRCARPTPN